jgi:hypothetical protein
MAERTIVALYDDLASAERAVRALEENGVDAREISIVANNVESGAAGGDRVGSVARDTATAAPEGAGAGAAIGAVLGGGASLLAAAGVLPIPGIGPVLAAGPLAAALAGAGIGAAAGGLVGGLVGLGVPQDEAQHYAEGVRRGGALVTVRLADDRAADRVVRTLESHEPADLAQRGSAWRNKGWQRFDEKGESWNAEAVEREWARWRVRRDDSAAAMSAGAGTRERVSDEVRELRQDSTIESDAKLAEMKGGPRPSSMSGMFGSAGAGAAAPGPQSGVAGVTGAGPAQPQKEPLKAHGDPDRGRVRSYTSEGVPLREAIDDAASGAKPGGAEASDPLAGHSRDRR